MPIKPDWKGRGNINLFSRPIVKNPDGSTSTVDSMSFGQDGKEILVPKVVGNRVVSDDEAEANYNKTGDFLGKFLSIPEANQYGQQLHEDMQNGYYTPPLATSRKSVDPSELEKVLMFLLTRKR